MRFYLLLLFSVVQLLTMETQAKTWTPDEVKDVIRKANTYWQTNNSAEVRAFWDNAAYHTGNIEVYKLLRDQQMLDYSIRWAEHNQWKGATEADPAKWKYKNYGEGQDYVLFGDWQICFQTYIDLYNIEEGGKRKVEKEYMVARAKEVMGYEAYSKAHDYWWWADALYMVMPVMTKMYKLTGDTKYLNKLYENICYCDSIMLDKETGLYFRDGKYVYPNHKTASGKKDFWARGDGWVLAGLAKVLQDMPETYVHQPFFVEKYINLARAVQKLQQPEGHWTRSMMDPQQAPGYETSGTAFFCYGLLWGVNHGYLSKKEFAPTIEKAWNYLSSVAMQSDGKIGYVQPIGERAIPGQTVDANSQANFGVGAFLLAACEYCRYLMQTATLQVTNPTDNQRHEIVETNYQTICQLLGISKGTPIIVYNGFGQQQTYQITYDDKLLLDVSVQPHSTATFHINVGKPQSFRYFVRGKIYPERADDLTWENDRCIYRMYGPALQRSGEKVYGTDVWVKNTPDLVVEDRYRQHMWGVGKRDSLYSIGQKNEAEDIYMATSFHYDHDYGLDCYGVGPSLGCGAPALMQDGKLVFPYCWKTCEILDNGPLRFTARLDYNTNKDGITEHRLVSLDKGSHFNRITVFYDGIKRPMAFASGVVLHSDDQYVLGRNYVLYADPTENPQVHQSQIYVATLFPDGVDKTLKLKGELSHALGIVNKYNGSPYTYFTGAAWSKYDVQTMAQWQLCADEFMQNIKHPLTIELQ